jgi:hypothetical protein
MAHTIPLTSFPGLARSELCARSTRTTHAYRAIYLMRSRLQSPDMARFAVHSRSRHDEPEALRDVCLPVIEREESEIARIASHEERAGEVPRVRTVQVRRVQNPRDLVGQGTFRKDPCDSAREGCVERNVLARANAASNSASSKFDETSSSNPCMRRRTRAPPASPNAMATRQDVSTYAAFTHPDPRGTAPRHRAAARPGQTRPTAPPSGPGLPLPAASPTAPRSFRRSSPCRRAVRPPRAGAGTSPILPWLAPERAAGSPTTSPSPRRSCRVS